MRATESTLGDAEAHLGTIETKITDAETHLGVIETKSTDAEAHLGTIDTNIANAEAHLGNIDAGVDVLEACVGSNKVNVNISSGNISGFATSTLQGTINTSLGTLETSLTSMENKQDTQVNHLSEIEGAVETLEACVGSNKVNVNISSGNISGFATESTLGDAEAHLGNIETAVQLIDNGYGDMTVTTLLSSSISASSTGTSTVFTKTREIEGFVFSAVADTNGSYDCFVEASVDNTTFFTLNGGQSFNVSGNAENFQEVGVAQMSAFFKFYRVRIANNHSSPQNFVVKICF